MMVSESKLQGAHEACSQFAFFQQLNSEWVALSVTKSDTARCDSL
jgi:hypothetical protein